MYTYFHEVSVYCRYPYLAVVLNFSQTWALYCLIQFYTATKEKLEPIKPLSKFLTFKSIVFLTWWQGIAVVFLFSTGLFKGHLAQRLQTRIHDYIICLEVCFDIAIFGSKVIHICFNRSC
jgi:site-specific recombinase